MLRNDNDSGSGVAGEYLTRGGEAIHTGHSDIHQGPVRLELIENANGLSGVFALACFGGDARKKPA